MAVKSPDHMALVSVLRGHRARIGLTQKALGEAMGWDQRTVSQMERGARDVSVTEFRRLSKIFNTDPRKLFDEFLEAIPPDPVKKKR